MISLVCSRVVESNNSPVPVTRNSRLASSIDSSSPAAQRPARLKTQIRAALTGSNLGMIGFQDIGKAVGPL
ncbi:MAG: hypothetical protein F4161_01575 [Gammaproteobacteria bacterium]|nr:hypothetical protein [Gammaproteobacteria bacterium]